MNTRVHLATLIEHTALSPIVTLAAIDQLCTEAVAEGFFGVCVHPVHIARCVAALRGTSRAVVTVVGFPLGMSLTETKASETRWVVSLGAHEVDMVVRVDAIKLGDDRVVVADVRAVVEAASGSPVKVILETGLLTDAEITRACRLAVDAGAQFVKTSTGFGPRGATVEDVRLMRAAVGSAAGVKASGGIRARAQAEALVLAGADRLGTSAGVAIVRGA